MTCGQESARQKLIDELGQFYGYEVSPNPVLIFFKTERLSCPRNVAVGIALGSLSHPCLIIAACTGRGGVGRAGLIAACCLLRLGLATSSEEAIWMVRGEEHATRLSGVQES